jgi:hypothetical protein
MVTGVLENVQKHGADSARAADGARVVALREDGASAPHEAVETACDADGKALHAARESARAICLCNDVDVRPLHRELDDPETEALAAELEGGTQGAGCARRAKVPDVRAQAHGDVDRVVAGDARASDVRDAGGRKALAAGAGTRPAPASEVEGKLGWAGDELLPPAARSKAGLRAAAVATLVTGRTHRAPDLIQALI